MFDRLTGEILLKEPSRVVVDVSGVGYEVLVPTSTSDTLPDRGRVHLFIYDTIHQDRVCLFGFATERERVLFRLLLDVSGVGPQTALTILSRCGVDRLLNATINNQPQMIQAVKGIGRKTSERIVLELSEKVQKLGIAAQTATRPSFEEAVTALMTLGYSRQQAESSVEKALKNLDPDSPLEELLKEALKSG